MHNILNQNQVNWSSTEIVRIAYIDEPDGNLILWIGVYSTPTRLSYDVGIEVAVQCKRLLLGYGIQDVDVELRESDFIQSARPALLKPTDIIDPTAIVRKPFTNTLGMNICAENSPWAEGMIGFFMAVNSVDNSQPRHNVQLLSEAAFQEHLVVIQKEIDGQDIIIASQEHRMAGVAGREDAEARQYTRMPRARRGKQRGGSSISQRPSRRSNGNGPLPRVVFSATLNFLPKSSSVLATLSNSSRKISPSSRLNHPRSTPPTFPEMSSTLERSTQTSS